MAAPQAYHAACCGIICPAGSMSGGLRRFLLEDRNSVEQKTFVCGLPLLFESRLANWHGTAALLPAAVVSGAFVQQL